MAPKNGLERNSAAPAKKPRSLPYQRFIVRPAVSRRPVQGSRTVYLHAAAGRRTLAGPVAPARESRRASGGVPNSILRASIGCSHLGASALSTTLLQSDLPGLHLRHRGKVRDVFDIPAQRLPAGAGDCLLMVATDRLSAFDVVLPDPIPGKGEMLCQISNFWFGKTEHIVRNQDRKST